MRGKHCCYLLAVACVCLAVLPLCFSLAVAAEQSVLAAQVQPGEQIGSGDGSIHIIPSLSAASVKNGGQLEIRVVVKAAEGVRQVEATIERVNNKDAKPVDTIILEPAPANLGGVSADGTLGLWQAKWEARSLTEGYYAVALQVTDRAGHVFTDRSLRFSDPIAGHDTPGNPVYPNGGLRRLDSLGLAQTERLIHSAVVDLAAGYAYFGTATSPGRVVKVSLGAGAYPPIWIGSIELNSGEDELRSAVIDTSAGYAYFGAQTNPGRIVKVALGTGDELPSRVGAVTLDTGEDYPSCAVIDPSAGYAWFGTMTAPVQVVKVALGSGSNPPTRVGAVTLDAGEDNARAAIINPAAGYAWFSTMTDPGRVIKVALGAGTDPPSRVGAVTFNSGEYDAMSGVIDTAAGYGYFGTRGYPGNPGQVVKVALGAGTNPPTRVGSVTMNSADESGLMGAVIDTSAGYAWFGTNTSPGRIIKVALGSGSSAPTRVGAVTMNTGEDGLRSGVIDTSTGFALFGTYADPALVVKVALGAGTDPPSRTGAVKLDASGNLLESALIDTATGYGYFGTSTTPGRVVKVALDTGADPPRYVGTLELNAGEDYLLPAVIDPSAGYAYFGTYTSPGRVVKVALGTGSNPPTRVAAVTLDAGEELLRRAVIDPSAGYAWFGTWTTPGRVVKIDLGTGSNPPTRVGAVTLNTGEDYLRMGVIDASAGYAYFGTNTDPGRVVKVALGSGSNPPTRVGAVTFNTGETDAICGVINPVAGYGWFGTRTSPGRVVKVSLGSGSNPPSRVGAATMDTGENTLHSALIDTSVGYAYFGTWTDPGRVVKVALGTGADPPSRVGGISLDTGESSLRSAVANSDISYAWFSTLTTPGQVVRVGLSQKGFIKANYFWMPEAGSVTSVRFYSHQATGAVRLGIYDSSFQLLWESGEITNTGANDFIVAPISSGTPSSLDLTPGVYYLAWQVNTTKSVPSYTQGSSLQDGIFVPCNYGAFPAELESSSIRWTDEVWTEYVAYQIAFDFAGGTEGWTSGGEPSVFTLPTFGWASETLKITSSTNTNTFGYWVSAQDALDAYSNNLYCARFNISTDITDQALVPQIRLRANSSNLQQYDVLSIDSAGLGESSPATLGTDYDLYFVPPGNTSYVTLAFDLLNFNPLDAAAAELMLNSVMVDRFDLTSLSAPTLVQDYAFGTSEEGWTSSGAPAAFDEPQFTYSSGALRLAATTNTSTFGSWINDSADITIVADKLYRGTFEVRTDVTTPASVPSMRLRFNAANMQASQMLGIESVGNGANSPGTTNTTYDNLYFMPPAGCVGEGLFVCFDMLNFDPADAAHGSLILDSATIETLTPPSLP